MSLGLNIKAFMKFVSNRFKMINESQTRQVNLIKTMIREHEKVQTKSVKESKELKSTISSLEQELAAVVNELNT